MDHQHLTPAQQAVMRTMRCDTFTAEVVRAFRTAGVASILLKGPALVRWLYDQDALRPYVDADLLVPPDQQEAAAAVLIGLGFEEFGLAAIPHDWPKHAKTWVRPDGANVDLHRTLVGVGRDPTILWSVLSEQTESIVVAAEEVIVLRPPGLALVVALHAAKDGRRVPKVRHDLLHALDRVPDDVWRTAASLADRIGATETFAAGLRLSPAGAALARRLELPTRRPVAVTLRSHGAPPLSVGIEWMFSTPGDRDRKLHLVLRKIVPPPQFLRAWTPLAQHGRIGLAAAYVWRAVWVLWRSGPALWAWWRARAETRRENRSHSSDHPGAD
jgi:hypothetical protein